MPQNDLTYRQLRIVEAKRGRARTALVVSGTALAAVVFWFLVMGLVLYLNSPCAVCGR